jgi:death-on-curing protein
LGRPRRRPWRRALDSAVAQAHRAWEYQDTDLFLIAATYAFHIAEAQAFLDGNKRTAVDAALTFLEFNGVELLDEPALTKHMLSNAMIALSVRSLEKAGLASLFRTLAVVPDAP